MKYNIKSLIAIVLGLVATGHCLGQNYTTTTAAGAGNDWNTVAAGWSSGAGASANPGATYQALSGALVRSPRSQPISTVTFPGLSLQIDYGAALRFKTSDIGTTTTYVFGGGGLILNGGQAQAGDAINSIVSGFMHVTAASSLTTSGPGGVLDTPNHPATDTRTFQFTADIDGSGLLTLMNGKTSISNPSSQGLPDFSFTGNNSLFLGGFLNVGGWLQVGGINSLGGGNLSVVGTTTGGNQAVFSSTLDLVSAGTLTLGSATDTTGSALILDHNLTFSAVTIDGTSLAAGSYNVADLTALGFGANIAGGSDGTGTIFLTVAAVPEPSAITMASIGGLAMMGLLRRRKA